MKVFITGIAGAIGSHLAERLCALGYEVSGIDAFTDFYDPRFKEQNAQCVEAAGAAVHRSNLLTENLDELLKDVEVIIHLAGQPGISALTSFENYLDNNIIATERLLKAASRAPKLSHFINGATSSVYGEIANGEETVELKPSSYYGVTKLAAEQLVLARFRLNGFPGTSLRFFSVYGERERPEKFFYKLIKSIHDDTEFPLHEGSETHIRSFSYVGDIVNGVVAVLKNKEKTVGEVFNLGTDVTATTGEGLSIIEDIIRKKAKIKKLPPRPGDQKETHANIGKIRRVLGYSPQTLLRDGLQKQVEWYKNTIHGKF